MLVGHLKKRIIFSSETNMAFSSQFYMVYVILNLQRKNYERSRQVNFIISRFILKISLLYDKNAQSKMNQHPKRDRTKLKKERFCLQITTAQVGLTTRGRQNQVKNRKGSSLR